MRVLMLLLIALAIGACTTGVSKAGEPQLKERDGVQFEVSDGQVSQVPFTGRWMDSYENGKAKAELTYKDGKKEGLARYWWENGQLRQELTLKDGKTEGLVRWWHEDGRLRAERCLRTTKKWIWHGAGDGRDGQDGVRGWPD